MTQMLQDIKRLKYTKPKQKNIWKNWNNNIFFMHAKASFRKKFKSMGFTFDWGEKVTFWVHNFFANAFINQDGYPWNKINNSISYVIYPDKSGNYVSSEDFKKRAILQANFFVNPKNINLVIKKYEQIISEFNKYIKIVEAVDFSKMSRPELIPYFNKFTAMAYKTAIWYRATRFDAETDITKHIKNVIRQYYSKEKTGEILQILTTSPYEDPIYEEKRDWIKLLNKKKIKKSDINRHVKSHLMFYTNIFSSIQLINTVNKKIIRDRRNVKKIEMEFSNSKAERKKILKEQQFILEKINSMRVESYLKLFHRFGEYRLRIKPGYAGIEIISIALIERIAELTGLTNEEIQEFFTIDEVKNFLKRGTLPSKDVISQRKICRVYIVSNRKPVILQGNEGIKFLKETVLKKQKLEEKYQGVIAYPGKVKGRVRIITSNSMEDIKKELKIFKKGDILVSDNTQPPMLPLMIKAAAIVTAIGGITSHSSIIAREFHIPCVVGVNSIHLKLEDGDIIEVDANSGIIKVLEKNTEASKNQLLNRE